MRKQGLAALLRSFDMRDPLAPHIVAHDGWDFMERVAAARGAELGRAERHGQLWTPWIRGGSYRLHVGPDACAAERDDDLREEHAMNRSSANMSEKNALPKETCDLVSGRPRRARHRAHDVPTTAGEVASFRAGSALGGALCRLLVGMLVLLWAAPAKSQTALDTVADYGAALSAYQHDGRIGSESHDELMSSLANWENMMHDRPPPNNFFFIPDETESWYLHQKYPLPGYPTFKQCMPGYGLTYEVPNGVYDGHNVVNVYAPQAKSQGVQIDDYRRLVGGTPWSFSPGQTLKQLWTLTEWYDTTNPDGSGYTTTCHLESRYLSDLPDGGRRSYQAAGLETPCEFTAASYETADQGFCFANVASHCTPATRAFSIEGGIFVDVSNSSAPVEHDPDGTVEVFSSTGGLGATGGPSDASSSETVAQTWNLAQRIDRNGNVTTLTNTAAGWTVTEPRGQTTTYSTSGTQSTLTKTGPLGVPQIWTLNWETITYDPMNAFPAIGSQLGFMCSNNLGADVSCDTTPYNSVSVSVLQSMQLPDGSSYQFSYGPFGNLTQVTEPHGAVTQWGYGNQTVTTFTPPMQADNHCPDYMEPVQDDNKPISKTVYPQGLSGASYTTRTTDDHSQTMATICVQASCGALLWEYTTNPDGTISKTARCSEGYPEGCSNIAYAGSIDDAVFALEKWDSTGSNLLEGTYHGNMTTGQMWLAFEVSETFDAGELGAYDDVRPTQIKHVKDGLTWWETFTYDQMSSSNGNLLASTGVYRTFGNTSTHTIANDCSGTPCSTPLVQTLTPFQYGSYVVYTAAPYVNLIRLPTSTKTEDGSGNILVRTDHFYDQNALAASSQPNLSTTYIVGGMRGNATTQTAYINPSSGTLPVSSATHYFDNGAVQKTQNPLDLAAGRYTTDVTAFDFGSCYASANPTVAVSGGGGSGAAGTCAVSGGVVSSCSVTSAGSGYTSEPTAVITGGAGSGATVTVNTPPRAVASLALIGGYISGYGGDFQTVPTLNFSDTSGSGSGAAAYVSNMNVLNIKLLTYGEGYISTPTCTLTGGGGSGATCACTALDGGDPGPGSCSVINKGSGYTSAPTCTLTGGLNGESGSVPATCLATITIAAMKLTSGGSGYTSPTVTVSGGSNWGEPVTVSAFLPPSGISGFTITNGGTGYVSSPPNLTLSTTVQNALGQSTTTVSDCVTGLTLSTKDVNGNLSCSQYDGLSRLVEAAAPGDTLSSETPCTASSSSPSSCYVRDTTNCGTSGTTIGNGGNGATTWTQYFPFGIGGVTYNQARTVTASRDGTPNGLQHVTFVDGLNRSIQQCSEVDPNTSTVAGGALSGDSAVCSTTVYDNMGRVYQQYVPFYPGASMPTAVAAYPTADQYTQTLYDGVGRVTSVQLMVSGTGQLPATITAYSISGTDWLTTVTDANSCQVRTWTDALGHTVEHQVQNEPSLASGKCSGSVSWLTTTMGYDVAGRLLTVTDPLSNQTTFAYDGLGRKTSMVDPDMGSWSYQYDNNGNLTQQTDARGAVINMHYDALNRVYLKDLPYWKVSTSQWVAGTPGEEDEYNYYDSAGALTGVDQGLPSTCYSCDDHCSTTTDACAAATLTCSNTGSTTGCPNQ